MANKTTERSFAGVTFVDYENLPEGIICGTPETLERLHGAIGEAVERAAGKWEGVKTREDYYFNKSQSADALFDMILKRLDEGSVRVINGTERNYAGVAFRLSTITGIEKSIEAYKAGEKTKPCQE